MRGKLYRLPYIARYAEVSVPLVRLWIVVIDGSACFKGLPPFGQTDEDQLNSEFQFWIDKGLLVVNVFKLNEDSIARG